MVVLYCMAALAFVAMITSFRKCKVELPEEPHEGYHIRLHVNEQQIVSAELLKDDKTVCIIDGEFKTEQEATQAVLMKYYKHLEAEYIQRTRRVNYAIGERQTVSKIKRTFAHTLKGREILEMMDYDKTEDD